MMKHLEPSPRVVAFIDILGMRELVRHPDSGFEFVQTFVRTIRTILSKELELTDAQGRTFSLSGWMRDADITITAISDSIVISAPLDLPFNRDRMPPVWAAFVLLQVVFWLQRALVQMGVLSRGGLAVGSLYHTQDIVVGEALIDAYEMESSVAIYPRVVLGDTFLDILLNHDIPEVFYMRPRVASMVDQDRDGLYFVDYLGVDLMEFEGDWFDRLDRIATELTAGVGATKDLRARQKISWALNYVERMLPFAKSEGLPPYASVGAFETRYPRLAGSGEES